MALADLPGGGQLKAIRWQPIRRVFVLHKPEAFGEKGSSPFTGCFAVFLGVFLAFSKPLPWVVSVAPPQHRP